MFNATKVVAAGVILAAFGGVLFFSAGVIAPQQADSLPGALSASPLASANADASQSTEAPATVAPQVVPDMSEVAGTLAMEQGGGQGVAGWSELGRVSMDPAKNTHYTEMNHLQAIGDRLVVLGAYHSPETGKGTHDAIFHSLDGVSWIPAHVPGDAPTISDLAATSDGLVAAGADEVDGARVARIWSSSDGMDWTEVEAPPELKRIDQIVSAEAPLAVRGGQQLWVDHGDGEWTSGTKLVNMSILKGPGGFLAWQFGDVAAVIHSADLTSWSEVGLPRKMSKGGANLLSDTQVFALDDQWVLVPHVVTSPDAIYTSPDGIEWTEAPRPPGIIAGAVQWMADIDGQVQAFGAVDGDQTDSAGIWTFTPGEPVAAAEIMAGRDLIHAPVALGSGYVATGLDMGRDSELTSWQRMPDTNG